MYVENTNRFNVYMTVCTVHDTKMYLKINIDRHLKFLMTRFRLSVSDITVHNYRYKIHIDNHLICPLCRIPQEAKLDFVLCCPVLRASRVQFILPKLYKVPSLSINLASSTENIHEKFSSIFVQSFSAAWHFKFLI